MPDARLVEFTPEELKQLRELSIDAHNLGTGPGSGYVKVPSALLAKALDALSRYREAERVALEAIELERREAEEAVTGVYRMPDRTPPRHGRLR